MNAAFPECANVSAITPGWAVAHRARRRNEGWLKQAVSGLDEAVGSVAQAASYAAGSREQGKAFKDNELKAQLEQLRDLESQIVETLKQTASQSGGKLKEELEPLSDHLKNSGTRTGEQVREAMQKLASGVSPARRARWVGDWRARPPSASQGQAAFWRRCPSRQAAE
jgi:gas vesicle protein